MKDVILTLSQKLHLLFTIKWKEDPLSFGLFLKNFRVKSKTNQGTFATELEISSADLNRIENTPNSIDLKMAEKFALKLGNTTNILVQQGLIEAYELSDVAVNMASQLEIPKTQPYAGF